VTQERVTGSVTLKLYKGTAAVVGRESDYALYDERFVTFGETTFISRVTLRASSGCTDFPAGPGDPGPGTGSAAQRRSETKSQEPATPGHRLTGKEISMSDHSSHKLWGGRFSIPTAAALDALNRSIGTDYRLWPFDNQSISGWAVALWGAEV